MLPGRSAPPPCGEDTAPRDSDTTPIMEKRYLVKPVCSERDHLSPVCHRNFQSINSDTSQYRKPRKYAALFKNRSSAETVPSCPKQSHKLPVDFGWDSDTFFLFSFKGYPFDCGSPYMLCFFRFRPLTPRATSSYVVGSMATAFCKRR